MHTCNCLCHLAPPIRSSHPYTTYTVVDVCVYVRQCGFCMSPPVLLNRIKSEIGVHVNPTTQPFSLSLSLSLLHTHADPNTERQSILHNVKSIDEHKSVSSLSLSLSLSLSRPSSERCRRHFVRIVSPPRFLAAMPHQHTSHPGAQRHVHGPTRHLVSFTTHYGRRASSLTNATWMRTSVSLCVSISATSTCALP